jgi:hypothetical protein
LPAAVVVLSAELILSLDGMLSLPLVELVLLFSSLSEVLLLLSLAGLTMGLDVGAVSAWHRLRQR